MRVGDIVEIDEKIQGKVLSSSNITYLDYEITKGKREKGYSKGQKRYIGVSPYTGNPRVKVIKRGKGRRVQTAEWVGL